tara:strand:+ start:1108 stop:1380 length:273 start_codon:yes stop_codon:yes gene_type:complete
MSSITNTAQILKQRLEDTIVGKYTGGCQEWINLISTSEQPTNKKEEVILECLNNLSSQFNATMSGNSPGDVTMWQQQLLQAISNADYLST